MSSTLANSQEVGEPVAQSSDAGESNEAFGSGSIVAVVLGSSSRGFASLGGALSGAGLLDSAVLGPSSRAFGSLGTAFPGDGLLDAAGLGTSSGGLVSLGRA
jgi:hypothetical protein